MSQSSCNESDNAIQGELSVKPGPIQTRSITRFSLRGLLVLVALLGPLFAYVAHQQNQQIPGPVHWDISTGENVKWQTKLGSQTYSNPTVHQKYVFIGSNNGGGFDPLLPSSVDLGVMLCFAYFL